MRKTSWAAALLLGTLLVLTIGCASKKATPVDNNGPGNISSVQIVLPSDTLDFLPGDSASVQGFVVVKDRNGNATPGVRVQISLNPILGYLLYTDNAKRDTTNDQGIVVFVFKSFAQSGNTVMTASASGGTYTDSRTIVVRSAPNRIASLHLNADRTVLDVPPSLEDSVVLSVTLADSNGIGIPNFHVRLQSPYGGRLRSLPGTDSTGRATTTWYSNHQYSQTLTDFFIFAYAGNLSDSVRITVSPLPDQGTLQLSANVRRVRADFCNTTAQLMGVLQDSRGQAIVGDTVRFSTPRIGSVTGFAITDSMGRARATFCGLDVPNFTTADSAVVVARYVKWGLVDSIHIYVAPVAQIANVILTAPSLEGIAGVDSTTLTVHAYYDDGERVTGAPVLFDRTCGRFTTDTMTLVNGTTQFPNYWHFCDQTNTSALVWCMVGDVTSDTLRFAVDPGPERRIRLLRDSSSIHIGSMVRIRAEVRDSLRNMVRSNVAVNFTSSFGTITPVSPVQTGDDGYAVAFLSPGTSGGPCTVKGSIAQGTVVDSSVVMVISGSASSIRIRVSNPSPEVHGAGGQDWSQIYADVYDANGNLVQNGQWVTFAIIGDPGGLCNLNGHGSTDSAQTSNGVAVVTFNSGTSMGPVNVGVYATVDGNTISAQASIINITAGPPAYIHVYPSNAGTDAGGAAWDLAVTALVSDIYNNRVRDSIAVFFDVQPDYAQILSDTAFTGNGQHQSGIAYTTMRFLSPNTNQTVQISARTADPFAVSTSISYKLPPQTPTIALYVTPSNWHFPTMGDPCHIDCRVLVIDGHSVAINGCRIRYAPARGRMYPQELTGNTPQYYQFTGPLPLGNQYETEDGHCSLWLRDLATNIFPDPNQPELNGDVTVYVEGFSGATDNKIINFRRGAGF